MKHFKGGASYKSLGNFGIMTRQASIPGFESLPGQSGSGMHPAFYMG